MLRTLLSAAAVAAIASSASANIVITEVSSSSSTNAPYDADWFELTNTGASSVDITGWKVDDNSNVFTSAVALSGITSIAPGSSVVFVDGDNSVATSFINAWFNGTAPSGFQIGSYTGSGIGLSTGGDAVNIFDSIGTPVASVTFGAATTLVSFDNSLATSGLPSTVLTTLSQVGTNGAFTSFAGNEVGSPGLIPEPATLGLLGLGSLLMGRRRRA